MAERFPNDIPIEAGRLPSRPLNERAITIFRVDAVIIAVVVFTLGAGASTILGFADQPRWIAVLPAAITLILGGLHVVVSPGLRWRNWRYDVDDEQVSLHHGYLLQVSTRIPMARIQHVDTRRGVLERRLGLASLIVYTAAGSRLIPGLLADDAAAIRDRIATLANVRDDVV